MLAMKMVIETTKTGSIEHCWVIVGVNLTERIFVGQLLRETSGSVARVTFDPNWVLKREEEKGDIIGFYHTHPGMSASPSSRDYDTMRAWVGCFGKPMLCFIEGVEGLKGYLFENDEDPPSKLKITKKLPVSLILGVARGK